MWTDRSSFTATEPLIIYTCECCDGPPREHDLIEIREHMHTEDRLAFPTCPYSIVLYGFLHDTTLDETRFGWMTLSGDMELRGAKHSVGMYEYHMYRFRK